MKIFVTNRRYIINQLSKNPLYITKAWFISIFSKIDGEPFSPFEDRFNVLKLQFDDVTEKDTVCKYGEYKHFDETMAKDIHKFCSEISERKPLIIHCDAGISRSGAVGIVLNDYFNKFLNNNENDYKEFLDNHKHISPNPEVQRILNKELFGSY